MIIIKGEMTDLNAYIKALNTHYITGNKIKQQETDRVYWDCMEQKTKGIADYPVKIIFHWYSKDSRKDIDNVAFGKKFILDGLTRAGVLADDSRKYVAALEDRFYIDAKNPRTEVQIERYAN